MPTTDKKTYTFNQGADTSRNMVSGVGGVALYPNSQRIAWGISNLTTGGYLSFAQGVTGGPTTLTDVLAPSTIMSKGDGGKFVDQFGNWKGAVWVSGSPVVSVGSANTLLYSIWEIYHS